jgi:hypothetical protein
MCFSATWSGTAFLALVFTAAVAFSANMNPRIPIVLLFLASKEALQYKLYDHLDSCDETNRLYTALSWVHISFQPFFILLLVQAFSKTPEYYTILLWLAFIFALFNMLRLKDISIWPTSLTGTCRPNQNGHICRKKTCSTKGRYHLAYGFHLNSADRAWYFPNLFTYVLLTYVPALILGDWPIPIIIAVLYFIAYWLTPDNDAEIAATWCMLSVVLIGIIWWSLLTGKKTLV